MSRTKPLIAIGVIISFIALAFSPVSSQIAIRESTKELVEQVKEVPVFFEDLALAMSKATSYSELIDIIDSFMDKWGRHPFLELLLEFIKGIMNVGNKLNIIRPLRKDAFVMSWGFAKKINPFKDNEFQLYRPITAWFYSGKSNLILNSRTVIITFFPFTVKMLTGRQFGLMRNFAGVYLHRETTLTDKSFTLFMGKTAAVRGFDLSILNVIGQ